MRPSTRIAQQPLPAGLFLSLADEAEIDRLIRFRHNLRRKVLLCFRAAPRAIELAQSIKRRHHLIFRIDDPTGEPVVDHFRNAAVAKGHDWWPAR
jgi:hypothetical protein